VVKGRDCYLRVNNPVSSDARVRISQVSNSFFFVSFFLFQVTRIHPLLLLGEHEMEGVGVYNQIRIESAGVAGHILHYLYRRLPEPISAPKDNYVKGPYILNLRL